MHHNFSTKLFFFIIGILSLNILLSQTVFSQNKLKENEVNELLNRTEEIRTSDFTQFSANLKKLKQMQYDVIFTAYQNCFYDYLIGYKNGFIGEYKRAKNDLNRVFRNCEDLSLKIRIKALLANMDVISNDYELAINNLDFVIVNIDKINDKSLKHNIYATTALLYRLVGQLDLSAMYSDLLIKDKPNSGYMCRGLSNKYRILLLQNYNGEFDEEINQAIELCHNNNELIHGNFLKLDLLNYKLNSNSATEEKIKEILISLKQAEIEIVKTNYKNLISVKDSMFAKVYWALKDYPKAYDYAQTSLEGSKSIGSTKQKITSLQILANYHQNKGEFEKAIGYLKEKNQSEILHYDDQEAKSMAYQRIKHENLAKTHKIISLNQENKVLLLENELSDKSAMIQKLSIMFLILLVAFFILWGFKNKKEQKVYKRLSERDHMTLIYNRKGLKDYMDYLLPFSKEHNQVVGFAIFDLDLFKSINDTYGHITGDWVIKKVIKTCQKTIPNNITLGRIGGEEFAIVLRDSKVDELRKYCEKCRNAISQIDTNKTGYNFKITASFGITSSQKSGFVYSALMSHADDALYSAKKNGRNNTVIYQSS